MGTGISSKMIEVGERVILEELGGADLGGLFSAPELAEKVYLAMRGVDSQAPCRSAERIPLT
jgi:hypothetical protein